MDENFDEKVDIGELFNDFHEKDQYFQNCYKVNRLYPETNSQHPS